MADQDRTRYKFFSTLLKTPQLKVSSFFEQEEAYNATQWQEIPTIAS